MDDADCCAVEGECDEEHDLDYVCGPFESTGEKYCFISCEGEDDGRGQHLADERPDGDVAPAEGMAEGAITDVRGEGDVAHDVVLALVPLPRLEHQTRRSAGLRPRPAQPITSPMA